MHTPEQWLQTVAQEYEIKSQAALSRLLELPRSSVSQTLGHVRAMSPSTAVRIADLLGVSPLLVLASTMHAQAKSEAEAQFWERVWHAETAEARKLPRYRYQGRPDLERIQKKGTVQQLPARPSRPAPAPDAAPPQDAPARPATGSS